MGGREKNGCACGGGERGGTKIITVRAQVGVAGSGMVTKASQFIKKRARYRSSWGISLYPHSGGESTRRKKKAPGRKNAKAW